MATKNQLQAFAESIARLVKDRERDDNDHIFDMPSDDAVDTLHSIISEARALTGTSDRRTEDDEGTNTETESAFIN